MLTAQEEQHERLQRQLNALLAEGKTQKEIGQALGVTERTIRNYLRSLEVRKQCEECGHVYPKPTLKHCPNCNSPEVRKREWRKRMEQLTQAQRDARLKALVEHATSAGDQCATWQEPSSSGYSRIRAGLPTTMAHRAVWEQVHGKIPEGYGLAHTCKNLACINPNHLRLVSQPDMQMLKRYRNLWTFEERLHYRRERLFAKARRVNDCLLLPVGQHGTPAYVKVEGHTLSPARVSWAVAHGHLPANGRIVPTCGNPGCIAPEHLEWIPPANREDDWVGRKRMF